jgi:segregation and condensation protein A
LEYEKFKNAAQMLYQREMIENASWSNPGDIGMEASELEPELNVTLYDLMLVFRDVLKRAEQRPLLEVTRDEFSVEQMMAFLFEKIVSTKGAAALTDILPDIASRRALITAFLALLELTRLQAIYLKQDKAFGEITARANPDYELSKSFSPA